jgi:DNA-binding phage protein
MSAQNPPLTSLDAIAAYLAAAFESGDADFTAAALSHVAVSPGSAELAAAIGIPRQQLADTLLSGELPLDLTLAIMKVIDLHLPGAQH